MFTNEEYELDFTDCSGFARISSHAHGPRLVSIYYIEKGKPLYLNLNIIRDYQLAYKTRNGNNKPKRSSAPQRTSQKMVHTQPSFMKSWLAIYQRVRKARSV